MAKVSVILPVRNAESMLPRALQSIQKQSFENWELKIVDDGSTDNTQLLAQEIAHSEPRIELTPNQGCGIAEALNTGIKKSDGRYIARMDADDWAYPKRLELQRSYLLERRDVGLVASRINYCGNSRNQLGYATYVEWTNSLTQWSEIRANRFIESPFAHPSVMFRRSIMETHGAYRDGPFPEDYELWLRWMSRGVRMVKLEDHLLNWHDSEDRLSRVDSRYSTESFYRIKARYLRIWLEDQGHHRRPIWIWGAGRITRKRARYLKNEGISFVGYIDIDLKKTGTILEGIPVIQPEDLNVNEHPFVISYVGIRGARNKISTYLENRGLKVEQDYILAA